MATARLYDQWEDAGMAFTEEDLESYSPQRWAEQRIEKMMGRYVVVCRRAELAEDKPQWWKDFASGIKKVVGWYCVAMELPKMEMDSASASLTAGKRLTAQARDLTPEVALGVWQTDAEAAMRHVVTLGRRCAGRGWKKGERSLSNKLANCVMREHTLAAKLERQLASK